MDLMKALAETGQQDQIIELIGSKLGMDGAQTSALVGQLLGSLGSSIQGNVQDPKGLESLVGALLKGQHDKFIDNPETAVSAKEEGNKILGHVLGGKTQSRAVAQTVSKATSVEAQIIKALLPVAATVLMGILSKNFGVANPQGLTGQAGGQANGLGNFVAMLDLNQNGTPIDDIMRIVGSLQTRAA